jgi:putative SOS response-associated peptidase YedK
LPISYNIAPSQEVLAIRFNPETKQRSLDRLRWGLVPYWAKDEKIGFRTINARAETVDTAYSFRSAFEKRRCLVPAEGFYEWKKVKIRAASSRVNKPENNDPGLLEEGEMEQVGRLIWI